MPDYTNITDVNNLRSSDQSADKDNREKAQETTLFLQHPQGQWEPEILNSFTTSGQPRYTFDKCSPIVDSISGELEQTDFGVRVRPAGGDSTVETAKLYDGIVRNIQAMSNADQTYNASERKMVICGFDAVEVIQDWAQTDSWDQDLFIRKVPNAIDRVWFDQAATEQNMSDARHAFVDLTMTCDEYEERWPEGSKASVGRIRESDAYSYKPKLITVSRLLYKKEVTKELVLMTNGKVYEDDEKFQQVVDDLAEQGITEKDRRPIKKHRVHSRIFDGKEFLTAEQETVFTYIPVIPIYGNFDISEDKVIYYGAVTKIMDAQRVLNYSQSRQVGEAVLSPRPKLMMTPEQAENHTDELKDMNTSASPVQLYNHQDSVPPPYKTPGPQINPGFSEITQSMNQNIVESGGVFAANQGNAANQSGIAIELQQAKGDNSTVKYFNASEVFTTHIGTVLIDAIPRVYDTKRTVRVLDEDMKTSRMVTINDLVLDKDTQELVELNDVRKGKYDVVSDTGPIFRSRQQETAKAFETLAVIDPSVIQDGADVWLSSLSSPGMDTMAERRRRRMLREGKIPDSQMTEEEKAELTQEIEQLEAEAANQGQDPVTMSIIEQTQANTQDINSKTMERQGNLQLKAQKQQLDEAKFVQQSQQDMMQLMLDRMTTIADVVNTQADSLKTIREAIGVDAIVGPGNTNAYKEQSENLSETIEGAENVSQFRTPT